MKFTVKPSNLNGSSYIPASKSHTIRAVFIASLAEGDSRIINPLKSADGLSAAAACSELGAEITLEEDWLISGTGGLIKTGKTVDVGNSGTTARLITGMASLGDGKTIISGDEQTRSRPMNSLIEALRNLGSDITSINGDGKLPVSVHGRMKGGSTEVSGVTSQFLSSLLINCPLSNGDTTIFVESLNEKPYVEMTLKWLDSQKICYENDNFKRFFIKGNQSYRPVNQRVPADFSSATFFLCAAAFTESEILLKGLDMEDTQGDKKVISFLKSMGADILVTEEGILVKGGKKLRGVEIDMNETPDALPAMAVTACFASGRTVLGNVAQARLKETDRISVMAEELGKLGARVEELPDGLVIYESDLKGAGVHGHGDHRVVMSLAIAGLRASGETVIEGAEAVDITFPAFKDIMEKLSGDISGL